MPWLAAALLLFLAAVGAVSCTDPDPAQPSAPAAVEPQAQPQPVQAEQPVEQEPEDEPPQQSVEAPEAPEAAEQPDTPPASQTVQQQVEPVQQQAQPAALVPQPDAPDAPAFDFETARSYLHRLIEELGPRASGTDEERAAAAWLAEEFERLGYDVELQTFDYRVSVTFMRIDLPSGESVNAFRFRNSGAGEASGALVNVPGVGLEADFAGVDVDGKVALVNRGAIEFRVKAANAQAAGAAALIVIDTGSGPGMTGTFGAYSSNIPVLMVQAEDGALLRSRIGQTLTVPPAPPETSDSQNVIARQPDSHCRVVVGGHYDTVPGVDGANDNGSGTALTLAFAALWSEHPSSSELCFVAFGAEEMGLYGSAAFVREYLSAAELSEVTAMLNLDAIGDGRAPYQIVASVELEALAEQVASALQLPASLGFLPEEIGSDHFSFAEFGVPVIFVFAPGAVLHVPADNLNNIDEGLFEDISRLNHALLGCLLLRAGSAITPPVPCAEPAP